MRAGKRLLGLLSILGLLAILAGVPVALVALGANPLPETISSLDEVLEILTSPDDGTAFIGLLEAIAWIAWAYIAVAVLLEIAAQARGVTAPRLPGLSLAQKGVRVMVATAALTFAALPAAQAAQAPADTQSHQPETTVTAPADVDAEQETPAAAEQDTQADQRTPETTTHVTQRGDTLWSLAETYYGDGSRYTEILDANRDVLPEPDWLSVGTSLTIPLDPSTDTAAENQATEQIGDQHVTEEGDTLWSLAEDHYGDGTRYTEIFDASTGTTQPGGSQLTDPDIIEVGWTLTIPSDTVTGTAAEPDTDQQPSEAGTAQESSERGDATGDQGQATNQLDSQEQEPSQERERQTEPQDTMIPPAAEADRDGAARDEADTAPDETAPVDVDDDTEASYPVATVAGVGAILAAGVLGIVGLRRRAQQRRRQPGQQMPMPTGNVAQTEQDLRVVADPMSREAVDAALRALAHSCTQARQPLPVVRAARLTRDQFDLYLADPADLPAPWTGTADASVWTLLVDNLPALDDVDVADIPAPYPSLVTIGHDNEDGHVFLDLEYLGALEIAGDPTTARAIIAALTVSLATSCWADDIHVTIVGAYPELEDTLQTGRIRYLPTIGGLLDELENRATEDRAALAEAGAPDLQHARTTGTTPDAWMPEIVLLAGPVTTHQRTRIENLLAGLPRVALAVVTTDGVSVGEWALDLNATDEPDTAVLSPIGLTIRPERIDQGTYDDILQLVALTETDAHQPTDPAATDTVTHLPTPTAPDEQETEDAPAENEQAATADLSGPLADFITPAATAPPEPPEADQPAAEEEPVAAEPSAPEVDEDEAEVQAMPVPPPFIRVLGPVDIDNARGSVERTKRNRLLEYATYLALYPGATHKAIDDAIWPDRRREDNLNTRNTHTSKLRSWIGKDPEGQPYLPRHSGGGYAFRDEVRTDWDVWNQLLPEGPMGAPTANLEQALDLVRGTPFEGVQARRYAWAETIRQEMISAIADASYELARRHMFSGAYRAAEQAITKGLAVEPALERLWRIRILAALEAGSLDRMREAIDRMLVLTDELGGDLEDATASLLDDLKHPDRVDVGHWKEAL